MKQFLKMLFASAIGTFIGILCLIVISIVAIYAGFSSASKVTYVPDRNENILKISMTGTIDDYAEESPLAVLLNDEPPLSLKDILTAIDRAKTNDDVKGVYLDIGHFSTGTACVDAIRRALKDFGESGKFTVAYADNYSQGGYYLASVADHVYLNPKGLVTLQGLSSETMFYKGLLQKAGIEMEVFKVGTYKGAVEPFTSNRLSDANREQITSYMGGIWKNVVREIADSRHLIAADIHHFADEGLFFADASAAVECGLIDSLQYRFEVEASVKKLSGQTSKELESLSVSEMIKVKTSTREYRNKVAVIYAEGEIVESAGEPYLIAQKNITESLSRKLRGLEENEEVKAVVLRVNSPGGSAYVSEQIWRQVDKLNKKKPVVVSMGSVAASGGYYISCAARKIVAEPNTLTGSIGIFGIFPNISGLFGKLDLTTDVVKTNRYADLGDASRPMTNDERALIQAYVERGYDLFLSRCAEGRGMSRDAIDAIAQGRVWTGEQGLELGLVDELGGIDRAIELAVELANIYNYTLINVPVSKNSIKDMLQKQLGAAKISMVKEVIGSEEYEIASLLQQIRTMHGIKARIPYDMKPL
ncbi:MAG: signal peptide peptidase SppA [Tannerella sp.]|jgi:protease-4|nr:signal peptide peptidase SppA [Tannerella sp.]